MKILKDYNGSQLKIGDFVNSIETGWKGKIIDTEVVNGEIMLVCSEWYFWDNSFDSREKRWYAPEDVKRKDQIKPTDTTESLL